MFRKLRIRLTFFYTIVLMLFLAVFITLSYQGMKWALSYELEQQVKLLTKEEAAEHLELYKYRGKLDRTGALGQGHAAENIFFYVLDDDGQIADSEEPPTILREAILSKIYSGNIIDGEVMAFSIITPDGQSTPFLITAQNIFNNQQYIGKVYLGKIITEYKKMRRQLLLTTLSVSTVFLVLAGAIGYLLAGQALIPIKKSFVRQQEFVADASHELRTPLSVLLTSTDVLQEDEENKLTTFSQQVLADMKDDIRRMSKIVDDLLALARADGQSLQLLKEKFDLEPVVERVVRSMQPLADDKQITLQLFTDNNITIYADRERISQLLVILIDNALKYTPESGKVIVEITFCPQNKNLKIQVTDTGIGIDKENQLKIFERFYRVDKIRSREKGGAGLGLSIARWIVESHEGSISVTSQLGKGTTFTINITV